MVGAGGAGAVGVAWGGSLFNLNSGSVSASGVGSGLEGRNRQALCAMGSLFSAVNVHAAEQRL